MKKVNKTSFLDTDRNFTGLGKSAYIFEDVFIDTKTGLVLDESKNVLWEVAYEALFWNPVIKGDVLKSPNKLQEVIIEKKNKFTEELESITSEEFENCYKFGADQQVIYMLHAFGWYPYGHLHDSIQRLFPWRDFFFENPLVLVSRTNKVVDFDLHINAAGFESSSIHRAHKFSRIVKVPKLFFGVSPAVYTSFTDESLKWITNGYRKVFGAPKNTITGIYLSRNSVKQGSRGVLNDLDVQEFLIKKGFVIVNGSESLEQIYNLFASAKYIVAPHGSLLANSIFCGDSSRIIEFCPDNREDHSFQLKNKHCLDYHYFLLKGDENFNVSIPLDTLEELINK